MLLWQYEHPTNTFVFSSHPGKISALQFDPYGDVFASANYHGPVSLWKFHLGNGRTHPSTVIQCHAKTTYDLKFLSSSTLFSTCGHSGDDRNVRIWDMLLPGHKSCVINFAASESDPRRILFDESGMRIFAACHRGEIEIYDIRMQRLYKSIVAHYNQHVTSIALHEGSLITAGSDGIIKAWDTSSGLDIKNSFTFSIDKVKPHRIDKQQVRLILI